MPDKWPERRPVTRSGPHTPRRRERYARRPGLTLYSLGVLATLAWPHDTVAQRTVQAQISIAPTIISLPATQIPLAIQIGPPEALPGNSFVRVRGLPFSVSLTEGYAIAPGAWAVPLFALPNLKANIPAGTSGRTDFVINLLSADGTLLAEARSALVIGTPVGAPPVERPADSGPVSPPAPVLAIRPQLPRVFELPPQEKARAERLLAKGEEYFASGNILGARDFFERAADVGLAAAALRLAATFDPAELQRAEAKGVVADRALARKWYERARELGAPEAVERLARLNGS
jgi:hypothetical protein